MDTTVCKECGNEVSHQELELHFKDLFDTIDDRKHVSDVEESILFNSYCTTCAQRFLVDEQRSQVYYDQ